MWKRVPLGGLQRGLGQGRRPSPPCPPARAGGTKDTSAPSCGAEPNRGLSSGRSPGKARGSINREPRLARGRGSWGCFSPAVAARWQPRCDEFAVLAPGSGCRSPRGGGDRKAAGQGRCGSHGPEDPWGWVFWEVWASSAADGGAFSPFRPRAGEPRRWSTP